MLSHKLTKQVVLEYCRLEEQYQEQCKNVLKRQLQISKRETDNNNNLFYFSF